MIYADDLEIPWKGKLWCHLITDGDDNELHGFALRLGLRREWYQGDHYDITLSKRAIAIKLGAALVTGAEMVRIRRDKRGIGGEG